jgi:pilus assembly protein Flp/PilA
VLTFARFVRNDSGVTASNIGQFAAGMLVAIISIVNGLGTNLNGVFTNVNTQLR